ncbi:hypothetical protein [Thalassotalea atypica]|uniref:hypothetical protein n=1 Tax=Thalassotalea atypica TaxID=2054316 RepID=UPI0025743BC0|nr:hypothetical protein [Thalassotalea atypica]
MMSYLRSAFIGTNLSVLALISFTLLLAGCGSSSDGDSGNGYLQFYNGSKNAPAVFLTIDENLNEDDEDEIEITYSAVEYGVATSAKEVADQHYYYELAWQNEDSNDREDLALISEGQLSVKKDVIQFIVLSEDIASPQVQIYEIDVIDDDIDEDEDLFNLRLLNLASDDAGVDVYMSKSNETFNEATLIGQFTNGQLSDNQKLDQDEYVVYITQAGSNEVLFQSGEIDYDYPSQYVLVVRESAAASTSPYAVDWVSTSSTVEYLDANSAANVRVYNAINRHDLLPHYQSEFDVHLNGVDDQAEITSLAMGALSETLVQPNGDYSVDLVASGTEERILKNHLLTLPEDANKTVFFYLKEDDVDHDNDGDVDEDGDGIVDEIEISVNSLVVDNSQRESIYDHNIAMINLVDSDDFSLVKFYFVRSDETIDSALYYKSVGYAQSLSLNLLNNTYQVFAIAQQNSSDIILSSFELTLNEESKELFLVIEGDELSATGYKITLAEQNET